MEVGYINSYGVAKVLQVNTCTMIVHVHLLHVQFTDLVVHNCLYVIRVIQSAILMERRLGSGQTHRMRKLLQNVF